MKDRWFGLIKLQMHAGIACVTVLLVMIVAMSGCRAGDAAKGSEESKPVAAVSIVPQSTFVGKVAGDLWDVVTVIPPGASPANYQPSPKEMTDISEASVYFAIDVPAEVGNILPNIAGLNEELLIVDLAEKVESIYPGRYFADEHDDEHSDEGDEHSVEGDEHSDEGDEHSHEGRDPHIWMSPRRVIVMVEAIRDTLSELDPDNAGTYADNAQAFIGELKQLDEELEVTLGSLDKKAFIITHPAMGYFADDYGLKMIALEQEGKESTAAHLQQVIDYALEHGIGVIFYQAEFDSNQARTIAEEIDGEVMELETLSPEYISNMKKINQTFESILN